MDETLLQLVNSRIADSSGRRTTADDCDQAQLATQLQQYNTLIDQTRTMKAVLDKLFESEPDAVKNEWSRSDYQ